MKVRIDLGEIHGYIEGDFYPDDGVTIVWNEHTTKEDLMIDFANAVRH